MDKLLCVSLKHLISKNKSNKRYLKCDPHVSGEKDNYGQSIEVAYNKTHHINCKQYATDIGIIVVEERVIDNQ